jgi:hypothetical protein
VEISLADLVRVFTPSANAIDGLGFDPTVSAHKAAVVDVLGWLVDRGALRLSDGSLEAWARDSAHGDALYDIDHDICAVLFKPARPVQHLTSAAGLLDDPLSRVDGAVHPQAVAQRARRLLTEQPVVYYADVGPAIADLLRRPGLAEDLARFTGLVVERRAEGVMLADAGGVFTDRPFPGRGGAVNRTAGLLLAKIADLLEEPGHDPVLIETPSQAEDHAELVARIDSGLPSEGVVQELAWTPPEVTDVGGPEGRTTAPLVEWSRLDTMIDELFEEFGAASFTSAWQQDPRGLLAAAVTFLGELSLVRPIPGGVLLLPAAVRYRNITLALADSTQLSLSGGETS